MTKPITPTAAIVLGLVRAGATTPYELKQAVAGSVGNFWSVPHSQLYAEPDRLAERGLLRCEQEAAGRRRKTYEITAAGERALAEWLAAPGSGSLPELRDPALLRLFFGADPATIAQAELAAYELKLAEYRALAALDDGSGPRGPRLALEAGIRHAEESVRFWRELA